MNEKSALTTYKPSLKNLFKRWLRDAYDHLGLTVVVSFIMAAIVAGLAYGTQIGGNFPPVVLLPLLFAFLLLVIGPFCVGIFTLAHNIVYNQQPGIGDLLDGYRKSLWTAIKWSALNLAIGAILIGDTVLFIGLTRQSKSWFGPAIVTAYLLIFWGMTLIYQLPILIYQRPSALNVLKKSALLVLDNLGFTAVVFFAIIAFTILCAAPKFVGMPIIYFGAVPILCTRATRELLVRYALAPEEREPDPVGDEWRLRG